MSDLKSTRQYPYQDPINELVEQMLDLWEDAFDATYFEQKDLSKANKLKQDFITANKNKIDKLIQEYQNK